MTTQEILLVEDSVDDAFLVMRVIEKHFPGLFQISHKVTMADAEAYIKGDTHPINLILLDLGLPDTKDGRDAFRRMKEYAPKIPIVILTGLEDHDIALSLVRDGAEDFVNKSLVHEKPELLRNVLDFATCRHQLTNNVTKEYEEKIKGKDDVISWMDGGYSIKK